MFVKKDYVVTYFNGNVENKRFTKRQLKKFIKNNVVRSIEKGKIATSYTIDPIDLNHAIDKYLYNTGISLEEANKLVISSMASSVTTVSNITSSILDANSVSVIDLHG